MIAERELPPSDRADAPDKYQPSPEQRTAVKRLTGLQEDLKRQGRKMTDQNFARLLGLGSAARWSRIKSFDYFTDVQSPGTVFVELRRAWERYTTANKYGQRFEDKAFETNEVFEAVFSAVEECTRKKMSDRRRIVTYLGKTGFGKTMLAWQLRERFGAVIVNANKSWAARGRTALTEICAQLHGCTPFTGMAVTIEGNILRELQSQPYVLVIDEAEHFGKALLDSIKRFINESNVVIVFLAYPQAYLNWNRRFEMESEQIRTRTHGIYEQKDLTPDMALPFLSRLEWHNEQHKLICAEFVVAQANLLGGFQLIDETVARLAGRKNVTEVQFKTAQGDEVRRMVTEPKTGRCK